MSTDILLRKYKAFKEYSRGRAIKLYGSVIVKLAQASLTVSRTCLNLQKGLRDNLINCSLKYKSVEFYRMGPRRI